MSMVCQGSSQVRVDGLAPSQQADIVEEVGEDRVHRRHLPALHQPDGEEVHHDAGRPGADPRRADRRLGEVDPRPFCQDHLQHHHAVSQEAQGQFLPLETFHRQQF